MALVSADIERRLSVKTGAAGDTVAGTPAGSLGKYMSTTAITDATVENLLRNIVASEGESGITIYRCFFILNDHASLTYKSAKVWILSEIVGGGAISIGLDATGVTARGQASAQAAEIADEETAPSGVTFTAPTTESVALSIGDIPFDDCAAVWVKMIVPPDTIALTLDQSVIQVKGLSDPI